MVNEPRPFILIYGNSPHLRGVERTLRADVSLRVIHIDPDDPNAGRQVAILGEGTLVYDAESANPVLIQAIQALFPRLATVHLGSGADISVQLQKHL